MKTTLKYTVAASLLTILLLAATHLDSRPACPPGMVYFPQGTFFSGLGKKEFVYLVTLCNSTVGNCYESWFAEETPKSLRKNPAFCMDIYEYPNTKWEYPQTAVSYTQAQSLCEQQGKRLCTDVEWERACSTNGDNTWSYGPRYDMGACNDESDGRSNIGHAGRSGMFPKCKSPAGIYDLNGNVAEWVINTSQTNGKMRLETDRMVRGGSYGDSPIFTRCGFREYREPDSTKQEIGFRCCSR